MNAAQAEWLKNEEKADTRWIMRLSQIKESLLALNSIVIGFPLTFQKCI